MQLTADLLILIGLEIAKRAVFEFPFPLPDAEAMGEGSIDFQRLACDASLLLRSNALQSAHIVQAVGQLDQHDARIVSHRDEHLAIRTDLRFLLGAALDRRQLGHTVDDLCELLAKVAAQIFQGDRCVLGHIM